MEDILVGIETIVSGLSLKQALHYAFSIVSVAIILVYFLTMKF